MDGVHDASTVAAGANIRTGLDVKALGPEARDHQPHQYEGEMTMTRMSTPNETQGPSRADRPTVFGLRYLEEEAAEVQDVVGCLIRVGGYTGTGCDDLDSPGPIYLV
jgi:hypothetical protein